MALAIADLVPNLIAKFSNELGKQVKIHNQNSNVTFFGAAEPEVLTSEDKWLIFRIVRQGFEFTVETAPGESYDSAWDDRETLFPVPSFANELSLVFDGINDSLEFGDVFQYDNANQWSLSIWVKPDNLSARRTIYSKSTNDANVFGWVYSMETGGPIFIQMRASGQLRQHTGTATLTASVWNHLAITYNGNQNINGLSIYINGVVDTTPATGSVTNTLLFAQNAMFGRRNTAFAWSGGMDEAAIYNTALNSTQVSEIYNSGAPVDPTGLSSAGFLQNYYRMGDGDAFPTIFDNQGLNNGVMTNMVAGAIVADVP